MENVNIALEFLQRSVSFLYIEITLTFVIVCADCMIKIILLLLLVFHNIRILGSSWNILINR